MNLAAYAAVAAVVAALSWRGRLLTGRGALAAFTVGVLALLAAGWWGGLALVSFFLPASLVSRLTIPPEQGLDPKGNTRGAAQVWANGLPPALGSTLLCLAGQDAAAWCALVGGLAAASADTWATSIGSRSRETPRQLPRLRRVPRGASGGVTLTGTLGAAAGAAVVALAAVLRGPAGLAAAAIMIGLGGMLLDSLLGATVQGRFLCPACGQPSEWRRHRCGTETIPQGGIAWISNDVVNALATAAATAAGAAWWWLSRA
ncbi:MAG TPA: DUF92 domain-containing protein [Gemmatimonadales bacterium]|jgi:uncharacterized protein (TIGR00297 family)|nr:DUF92 domain-containing protein [Gemmatimonadales bacterium]